MSDTNNAGAEGAALEPETESQNFDAEFADFLGHKFDAGEGVPTNEDPPAETASAGTGTDTISAGAGSDTIQAATSPPASPPSSVAAGSADPPASAIVPAITPDPNAAPAVDPADLAKMLGLGTTQVSTVTAVTGSDTVSAGTSEVPFAPFDPKTWKIPAPLATAIFEGEDPESRNTALVTLLSHFGNAVLQQADARFKDYHAPAIYTGVGERMNTAQTQVAIQRDLYGEYPELQPHSEVVKKAFLVLAERDPSLKYTTENRDKAAALAVHVLRSSGVLAGTGALLPVSKRNGGGAAPISPPAVVTPPKKNGSVFEAGGARPGGGGISGETPESLVAQLTEFG